MEPPWATMALAKVLIGFIVPLCYVDASSPSTSVRLVGVNSKYAGRLEVFHNGVWGTVCDDGASNAIADVVCKQLGYDSNIRRIKDNAYFGPGTGPIWMDDVRCTGNEVSIDKCYFRGWRNHNCRHGEDLSVLCTRYVTGVSPSYGSVEGGTALTIEGKGFSNNNFNYFPGTEHLGNKVFLVNDHSIFPCDVNAQKTSTTKIICITTSMPQGDYGIKVSVDGIPGRNTDRFQTNDANTPTITEIIPTSGPPGTLMTIKGRIFTSKYGLNASTNGRKEEISRVMAGGDMCDLVSPDGQTYGISLDSNGRSNDGVMTCRLSELGSKIGNINASFILSALGWSKTNLNLYRVSRNGQIFMFQSYAEIEAISPSSGSIEGGTVITIAGRHFDETRSKAAIKVRGTDCHVIHVNVTAVICRMSRKPNTTGNLHPGNRGIIVESWTDTVAGGNNLEMVKTLNESSHDYQVMVADTTQIPGGSSKRFVNRMKGFLRPPFNGEYQFVVTADVGAQLYLSTDEDEKNLVLLTGRDRRGTYSSNAISLQSNESYYMEVLYRQTFRSLAVKVGLRYLDSLVNHYMAGNVQQEVQEIEISSKIIKEQQTITIPDISNETAVYEEQLIIVEDSNDGLEPGRFRLGMYSVYTERIAVGVSAIGMMNALQELPVFDVSETVLVDRTTHGRGFKYAVTFLSERGNFPLIEWKRVSGDFTLIVNKTRDGRPSGRKVGLMMAGIPAPLIDRNASLSEISDALGTLFSARCPSYWTNPKRDAIYYSMEDGTPLPSYIGSQTNSYQAFCGNGVVMNPSYIHYSRWSSSEDIYLTIKPFFCVAVKGSISYVYMYYSYTDGNGKILHSSHDFFDLMEAMDTDTEKWGYGCYNLRNKIAEVIPAEATNIVLKQLRMHYSGEVLVDEVYFGPQATTSDTDDAYMRRLVCSPNGYKITDVHVTMFDSKYDVTLTTVDGGHDFPLFTVDETQFPPDTNVSIVRAAVASPPLSGTFDLTLRGQTLESIPVGLTVDEMETVLQEFKDVGFIKIINHYNNSYHKRWRFSFDTYPGNVEQIQLNTSSVIGDNPTPYVRTIHDWEYKIDPLYGEMLQTVHDTPQVIVTINDVPSRCAGSCSFEWLESCTPIINNVSRMEEAPYRRIQISGIGFSETLTDNHLTIAGVVCNVTMATSEMIMCDIDEVIGGEHKVVLDVQGKGLAKYGDGNVTLSFRMQIDTISPTSSGLGGFVELSISGTGFSDNSSVTVGDKTCNRIFVNTTNIICLIPPTSDAGTVPITVEQTGEIPVTADVQFTYDISVTPRVTSISPTATGVSGEDVLLVSGAEFEEDGYISLMVDGTETNITFYNDTYITAKLPPCSPGSHDVIIIVGDNGAALTSESKLPSIVCTLEVTNVTPLFGSLFGGTRLTLSGKGFKPGVAVKVGTQNCDVEVSTDNQIVCQIERIRTVHRVNNHGIHPNFGKYYYWSPQHVQVMVGDIVRWDWDFPFYITTMKPKIEETFNMTAKYGKPGGFSSGSIGTNTGFYSHEFSKAGMYYYWSGLIDKYGTTWFHGSVEVAERTSYLADITVTLDGFEAIHNLATETKPTGSKACSDTSASRESCSEPFPENKTDNTKLKFAFWICASPIVNTISLQNGTTNDNILITGNGFSSVNCANNVSFGDYECMVFNGSETYLLCNINPENKPRIGRPQYLEVQVDNIGYAHVREDKFFLKTFVLFPLVNQIHPVTGSRGGHTRMTISGTGFGDGDFSYMTDVTIGGYPCDIESSSYYRIVCFTPKFSSGNREVSVTVRTDNSLIIPAECETSCYFKYDDSITPTLTGISPISITGLNETTITISGTGFGEETPNVHVTMTSLEKHPCQVTNVSYSQIVCRVTSLPVGENLVEVDISEKGRALHPNREVKLASLATISAILPTEGSKYGGADVTIFGNGFLSDVRVQINGSPCKIKNRTLKSVMFTTDANPIGNRVVNIWSNGIAYPYQTFNFTEDASPGIIAISPPSGTSGQNITIIGFNFGTTLNQTHVFIGNSICSTVAVEDIEINCTVGNIRSGTYNVYVNVEGYGNSNSDELFTINMTAEAIAPSSGSLAGGQAVTILGTGFDDEMEITICGRVCNKSQSHKTESTKQVCYTPHSLGSSVMKCAVHVTVNNVTETLTDAYTYNPVVTPVIDDVTPTRGGTQGGTQITISGSNFGSTPDKMEGCASSVTVGGTLCNITSWSNTQVVCITEAHSRSERTFVSIERGCYGISDGAKAGFHFVDVWSSVYTWGGADLGLPTAGDIVVIPKGQTIMFDTNTPVLKMLVIQGGELVFDERDVELQAENILITDGGLLQVGTEEAPFQHKATITLHGHHRSKELPIYGTKAIIVREGTLDLHGAHIPTTWTRLSRSTAVGDTTIQLIDWVTWQKGDQIIISTTGGVDSQSETEVVKIAFVETDNKTITLNSALTNPHLGYYGPEYSLSAEVGLLTRNVVIRGYSDPEWVGEIKACPDGFDSGYFATRTCAQGRYGDGMGSDAFGAQIIIHTTDPTRQLTKSKIEYVELYHVGQAFRLGRHPINFHVTGDMSRSYVRGCSIYDTFNRAINIRDTQNLLVDRNVFFNVKGVGICLEEGTETGNVFQYNLGVFVKGSSQLLNDDISAATFWITNPNNTFRHNVATGGTHFGYFLYLENAVSSFVTGNHRPQLTPLAEFNNNTAHSLGMYGLWINPRYIPRVMYSFNSYSSTRKVTVIDNMKVWNCRKGIFVEQIGALQIRGLIAVQNVESGYEGKEIVEGNQYTFDSPSLEDSIITGYMTDIQSNGCTQQGVASPYKFGFTIRNVSFVNFDKPDCSALAITRIPERCDSLCGGYMYRTQNLTFTNVDHRVSNDWIWESVYEDIDGSLCGTPLCKVVPCTGTLSSICTLFSNSSNVPLCTCPGDVKLFRFAVSSYSSASSSWPIVFSNTYGSTRHQYRYRAIDPSRGWMTNLIAGESYLWEFDSQVLTNFSYSGIFYRLQYGDYVIISQKLTGEPDEFRIDGYNLISATNETLDPATHYHGDWEYNETTGMIKYLISYRRRGYRGNNSTQDISVNLQIKKCFFKGCVTPPTLPPTTSQTTPPQSCVYWSSLTSWPNNKLPGDGEDVTISKGVCMIADTEIPKLNKLIIYDVLEFDHGPVNGSYRNFTLSVTDLIIIGGNLLIGSPYDPFLGKIDIILRGQRPGYSDAEEYLPNTGIPVNSKAIAVYGGLELHGKDVGVPWTRLVTTGNPGDSSITLADNVTWEMGQEIVITPTSYDVMETETFKITRVSDDGCTLSLNDSLQFRHIAHEETINGQRVVMSAKVGLLTRNIRVLGEEEDAMYTNNYGGRMVVGANIADNEFHTGFARISNVEFHHTGQSYWSSQSDKRPSLIYNNAGTVTTDKPSSVTKCVFHHNFAAAIGVYGTNGLSLTGNVIHHTVSLAIETNALRTSIQRNLITLVKGSNSYGGAINGMGSRELTLKDNTVSGTNGVAFRFPAVECGATSSPSGNEAHSSSMGIAVFPGDSAQGSCFQISNYFIWKCSDIGIYYNNELSVILKDNILAENTLGLYAQVIGPDPVQHLYSQKYCTVKDSLFIGTTSSYNYSIDQAAAATLNTGITGGHVGLTFTSFMGGSNGAPTYDLTGIRTYPAIMGVTNIQDVTFAHFKTMGDTKDTMLTTNKANDDGQHPVLTRRITQFDSENDTYFFIHRPNVEKINPSDCVDMDCDGLKKALITDEDGSFLGRKGSVFSESEWEWNGDPRRGLGDYRIPREMLTSLSGERINVSSIAPNKGIIRNDQCLYRTAWQAYECHDLDYMMLIIESLDADTETRRLSPVAILGDGYLDLINGPQDHSACSQGNCRKRLSTFMSIIASDACYLLHFTTTSPQTMRLFLLNANDNNAVTLKIWYSQSNRRDVYVNDELVLAKNAHMVDGKYVVDPPTSDKDFIPDIESNDVTGANFFDRNSNILYVLIRGRSPVKIVTNPSFIVSFQIPALTSDEFYGDALVHNLALFFDVPPEKIRVVNVVRESGRQRRNADGDGGINVQVEISDSPTATENATVNETLTTESMMNLSSKFINTIQGGGDISKVLNMSVSGVSITEPTPEVRKDGKYKKRSAGKIKSPKSMRMSVQPTRAYEKLPFPTQPCLQVFDEQDNPMTLVGGSGDPWQITAYLEPNSHQSAQLLGNTTVDIVNGWANFTDLRISKHDENFCIKFNKTHPENRVSLINRTDHFTVNKLNISLGINTSEEIIIANNVTEMTIGLVNYDGNDIDSLGKIGGNWTAAVEVSSIPDPPGNLTGSRSVTFDPSNGKAVFANLSFDQTGNYILRFTVKAKPGDYSISRTKRIQVLNQNLVELVTDNTTMESFFSLTFEEDFDSVVGNKTDEFRAYMVNTLSSAYPNVLLDCYSVTEGSIDAEMGVKASSDDMENITGTLNETFTLLNNPFNNVTLGPPRVKRYWKAHSTITSTTIQTTATASTALNITSEHSDTTMPATTTKQASTKETTDITSTSGGSSSATYETSTPKLSSAAALSVPVVVVTTLTPLVFLLGAVFVVIILKYRKMQKHEIQEHLTRTSMAGSDEGFTGKGEMGNEYSTLKPPSIGYDITPQHHQMSRMQRNIVLRPYSPTYEIQNQQRSAKAENHRRNRYQQSGSEDGPSSLEYYTGKRQ